MLQEFGEVFGYAIVVLFVLTVLNYVFKAVNRKYRNELKKNEKVFKVFSAIMKFLVRNHKLFGLLTVAFILLHFYVEFTNYGFIKTNGAVAAITMLLQVALGIYGSVTKTRSKVWLYAHRLISLLLLIVLAIHIL